MVERSGGVSFPAVLFDGEREIDMGCVVVSNLTRFNNFQIYISQIIGISPNRLSIFLVYNDERMVRRKIHLSSHFDFDTIPTEKNCFFLVDLKRKRNSNGNEDTYHFSPAILTHQPNTTFPQENLMIRPWNSNINNHNQPFSTERRFGYDQRIMNVTGMPTIGEVKNSAVFCDECLRGSSTAFNGGFHRCVYDPVVVGFRTSAGPIARPGKRPE